MSAQQLYSKPAYQTTIYFSDYVSQFQSSSYSDVRQSDSQLFHLSSLLEYQTR